MLNPSQQQMFLAIKSDIPVFSGTFLKIRTKNGSIKPLILNKSQLYLHKLIEDQVSRTGMARKVILKGRQQGISTYISGRYFNRTAYTPGTRCYILTHEQLATDNLFGMAKMYYDNMPPELAPELGIANAKELSFEKIGSTYKAVTAGNKTTGRSDTANLVHGSEVAYWPNAASHMAGLMQAVALVPGNEILLESTANGIGNKFHDLWEQAERGLGGWEPVFIPWYWQDEYALTDEMASTLGVRLIPEDREYAELHGLSRQASLWRRMKIDEMGDELLFKREYPTTPSEAFETSDENSFMDSSSVIKARKCTMTLRDNDHAPTILGIDPARRGLDSTTTTLRKGRYSERLDKVNGLDTMAVVGKTIGFIQKHRPNAVFIDMAGIGSGIVDRLRELGYTIVRGVDFGGSPMNAKLYTNKRNEMWGLMKQWILDQPAKIPDNDTLHTDLTGIKIDRYDSHGRVILEAKDEFKARFHRSPDDGDSLALTFAFPVVDYEAERKLMRQTGMDEDFDDDIRISVPGMGY